MEALEKFAVSNLKPLAADVRDFAFHEVHGEVSISQMPDFDIADGDPIIINQGSLGECDGAMSAEANTVFRSDGASLVDYLISKGMLSDLESRSAYALRYGLVPDSQTYVNMAHAGTNGPINSKLLALMRYDGGDCMDFLYQYAKICQVMGIATTDGADLRSGPQSLKSYGSIRVNQSPFTFGTGKSTDRTAQQLSDWTQWPASLDAIAAKNRVPSYFAVTGTGTPFQNIASALWLNKQNGVKSGVLWGLYYKSQWVSPAGGIIVDDNLGPTANSIGGHAMFARGLKTINGIQYLKVQQSWGRGFGDGGIAYFPASVINENFPIFGAFTLSNIPQATAFYYLQNGIMLSDNWLIQLGKVIKNLI